MVGADGAPLMYAKRLKRRAVQHAAAPSACDEGLTQVSDLRTPSSNAAAAAPESSIAEAAQGSREQSRHLNINKTDACHEYRHAAGRKQGDAAVSSARFSDDFRSLGIKEWLHRICKTLGMTKPTEVQAACIPAILDGRSVIGSAHTGSGKTAAFALPILQLLAADRYGVFALVLTPTRYAHLGNVFGRNICRTTDTEDSTPYMPLQSWQQTRACVLQRTCVPADRAV